MVKYLFHSVAFNLKSLTVNYWGYQTQLFVLKDFCFIDVQFCIGQ